MIARMKAGLATLAAAMVLAACGGGGGSAGDTPLVPGGGGTTTPVVAADLTLTLDALTLPNAGTSTITATATALDANRNTLAAVPVTIVVDSNATATVSGTATSDTGTLTAAIGIGADHSNRVITVTATSSSITRTASFQVTGSKITATLVLAVNPSSVGNTIQYRVTDVNSNSMPDQDITVSAPGLPTVTGVTNSTGAFTYTYDAPASPGSLTVTATAAGVSDIQQVQVIAPSGGVPVAVGPVSSASVSANPSVVAVNSATSSNQTEIRALFVGAANLPIPNVRVRFDLNGDPNSIGGSLAAGSTQVYTNANGVVTTAYVAGTRSSPTDGVQVRACWSYTDFAAGTCPNAEIVTLTVTSEPLSVSIGTNALIVVGTEKLTYIKQYVVQVVNSAGQAMSGVAISPLIDLPGYGKGYYTVGEGGWEQTWTAGCTAEDVNRNGVLDLGEDFNGNGTLEPRKADVTIRMINATTTDSGLAVLQIEYPQSVASWVNFKITVTATGVLGTEGQATFAGVLPVLAADVTSTDSTPPFYRSPYGVASSCTNPN